MGVGSARRISSVNWKVVKDMVMEWVQPIPVLGMQGYLLTTLCQ